MGRRKIEIKPIKDDRNRSVTFLKRKGGLFKKAHELSVLCSVNVAVIIFGTNKKLYEYSSTDMREMITRYTYHGGPNEHKGPSDYNGGNVEEDESGVDGTPPQRHSMEPQMMPPQFQGQPPYSHMRNHTPSASPPIPNGAVFQQHPGHPGARGHTPQPQMGSRPSSRNDVRRIGPNMMPQHPGAPGPQGPVNGFAYMPNPAIYNPQTTPPMPPHGLPQHHPQYPPYPPPQPQNQPSHPQMPPQYMEDQRRSSLPPNYPPQQPQQPQPPASRPEPSPQPLPQQLPQPSAHMSPPPPQPQQLEAPPPQRQPQEPQPPGPADIKRELPERPQVSLLTSDAAIKRLPQRKQHSIFTPIDENRSILSQHLASFTTEPESVKGVEGNRSQSVDVAAVSRTNGSLSKSPPGPKRANTQALSKNRPPVSIPETTFTPPSRSNSLKVGGGASRPRLKVQIPDGDSENGGSAGGDTTSPRLNTDTAAQSARPSHIIQVLPPPSPSASALLSAGATGPPNPFARPAVPQTNGNGGSLNVDTPVSALPSRFLNNEFLPSPSSFYPNWDFRGSDSNTLPSPLNFATPVVGTGPSFLRDDNPAGGSLGKRKSPEASVNGAGEAAENPDAKRHKAE